MSECHFHIYVFEFGAGFCVHMCRVCLFFVFGIGALMRTTSLLVLSIIHGVGRIHSRKLPSITTHTRVSLLPHNKTSRTQHAQNTYHPTKQTNRTATMRGHFAFFSREQREHKRAIAVAAARTRGQPKNFPIVVDAASDGYCCCCSAVGSSARFWPIERIAQKTLTRTLNTSRIESN